MNIARLIESSFIEATKALTMGTSSRSLARARERSFAKALIAQFQREFDGDDHRVFATALRGNATDFGANQLLYDIAVCHIGAGETAERKSEDFHFIARALWQIEIDFSREWRQTLYAINRLNCGGAADKLLITSRLARSQAQFLNTFRAPGAAVEGRLHLAFVPHPADWDDDDALPQVWRIDAGEWEEVK